MIEFGCLAHYDHFLSEDIQLAKSNNFRFLQIWYDKDGISLNKENNKIESLISSNYPCIIHAVLDINEFDLHIPRLQAILKSLGHKEIIIHPICASEPIDQNTIYKLSSKINNANLVLNEDGIKLFVENNSKIDPIVNSTRDIEIIFNENPNVGLLLDIAHIDNYVHLQEIVKIKQPKILHIADRHLENTHEHLPIGQGNIDFTYIFTNILHNFNGRIILEITQSNQELIDSKKELDAILNKRKRPTTAST
jgi:hypothetical protein